MSDPDTPSTMLWCSFEMNAHRPWERPSTNQYSHSGRPRSIRPDITLAMRRFSSSRPPGEGRAVLRMCQRTSNCGSSTQAGAPRSKGTVCSFCRYRGSTGSRPSMASTNSSNAGAGPWNTVRAPMAREELGILVLGVEEGCRQRGQTFHASMMEPGGHARRGPKVTGCGVERPRSRCRTERGARLLSNASRPEEAR